MNVLRNPKIKFCEAISFDIVLSFLFMQIIHFFSECYSNLNLNNIISFAILAFAFLAFFFLYLKTIKKELEKLPYSYRNIYLFRRFAFIYEALIVVSLSFLLGISSSVLAVFEINDAITHFKINAFLVGASCITASTKATINYTFTIWDATHKKRGETLYG